MILSERWGKIDRRPFTDGEMYNIAGAIREDPNADVRFKRGTGAIGVYPLGMRRPDTYFALFRSDDRCTLKIKHERGKNLRVQELMQRTGLIALDGHLRLP